MRLEETIKPNARMLINKSMEYVNKFLKEVSPKERAELCKELTELLKADGAMAR